MKNKITELSLTSKRLYDEAGHERLCSPFQLEQKKISPLASIGFGEISYQTVASQDDGQST